MTIEERRIKDWLIAGREDRQLKPQLPEEKRRLVRERFRRLRRKPQGAAIA